jgi:AI-2 transport protein TqsA
LQVPYALLLGTMTFALNYIPTFGSFIAGLIATAVALIHAPGVSPALPVFLTYVGVNAVLGSYLEPKILGRELNLSPLVVIISVVVWAGLWGAVGTFLAVPLTSAMQIILASNETTMPIAVMLSSGPPREERRPRRGRHEDAERPEQSSR